MNGTLQSLAGQLLIAMPNLADPNFWQAVVLLGVHSDDEGAFGLIINRTLDVDMRDVLQELGEKAAPGELPEVFGGGPVQPSHGSIVVSGSTETLTRLTQEVGDTRYFLLLGYAGWYPGQLEREIEENSWVIAPFDTSIIFEVPAEERWAAALRSIGIDPGTLVDAGSTEPS